MMRYRILVRKLGFLHCVIESNPVSLTGHVILALCDDADSLCLVKECKELEEWFGSTITDIIFSGSLGSIREMKKDILELDKKNHADKEGPYCCRSLMMDQLGPALDLGWKTVKGLQLLSRALSHHRRGNHPCHLCDVAPPPELSVLDHILVSHWEELRLDSSLDYKNLTNLLEKIHSVLLSKLSNIFIT